MAGGELLNEFQHACQHGSARSATTSDSIEGLCPSIIATPASNEEISRVLALGSQHDLATICRGAGTKLDWGGVPRRADILLDLSKMSGVLEHNAGDLVVRVRSGTPLATLQTSLASKGQRLPLDEVVPGSTVGGIVATAIAGPSRYGFGAVRDLLIGCNLALADGTAIRAGSKVVKNVAGYDLSKLIVGSFGTLGVLTEAIFRLRPLPQETQFARAEFVSTREFARAFQAIMNSQIAPTAIELDRMVPNGPTIVTVCVEGRREAVSARAEEARRLLGDTPIEARAPAGFGRLSGSIVLKATSALGEIPDLVDSIDELSGRLGLALRVSGSAGTGVLYIGLAEEPAPGAAAEFIGELREGRRRQDGSLVVVRAPVALRRTLDIFGEVAGLSIMEKIKDEFDPLHLLSPGRFVGTI